MSMPSANGPVVILQRVIPHYRVPLFTRLHEQHGWIVATAEKPPTGTGLSLAQEYGFARTFDFKFSNPRNPYVVSVPTGKIIASLRPSAIIAEFGLRMSSTWTLAARRSAGLAPPVLFWSHGYNMELTPGTLRTRTVNRMHAWLSARVDGHLTYTQTGKAFLERFMPANRIVAVGNTIDTEAIQAIARKSTPATLGDGPILLFSGRFTPDKNILGLVRSFLLFREHYPNAVLVVIGDGPDTPAIRMLAGNLLGTAIRLTGTLYDEADLAPYFLAADVYVIAGAVGLSVNHALAYGLPVLCFAHSATGPRHHPEIDYVLDNVTGWKVAPFSDEALANTLIDLFKSGQNPRNTLNPTIRLFVERTLQLDRVVERFSTALSLVRSRAE